MSSLKSILKARGARYGSFETHAEISQELMNVILKYSKQSKLNTVYGKVLLEAFHREALFMICHKIARIVNGDPNYDDSWVDIAGYSQLVVDILRGRNEINRHARKSRNRNITSRKRVRRDSRTRKKGRGRLTA
jgi:hypothetical protein